MAARGKVSDQGNYESKAVVLLANEPQAVGEGVGATRLWGGTLLNHAVFGYVS
jgi:hypothetical protein